MGTLLHQQQHSLPESLGLQTVAETPSLDARVPFAKFEFWQATKTSIQSAALPPLYLQSS
jgi:hypothetical protein